MKKYFTPLLLSVFMLFCLTACEDKAADGNSETKVPEEFTLRILGLEGNSILTEYKVVENAAANELDVIELTASANENRLYLDFRVPARLSYSGRKEQLSIELVHSDVPEKIWTFAEVYNTVYYMNLPYVQHFAVATYEISGESDEEDQVFYSVNSLDPGKVTITSFENGRLKGEFGGDIGESLNLITDGNTALIRLAGTFDARLTDDDLE